MAEERSFSSGPAIGIDLGTTFSCVGVVQNGKVKIIPNEQGDRTTPSFVAFDEHERLIGDTAKQQIAANAENTVFDAKRLIGRKFDDPVVQKEMQQWPFRVVEINGMPKIEITYKNEVKRFAAEEISAMVLSKMKEIAEDYLNASVTNAVITVPAYFNDMQRKATRDAAKIAGLNVSRIINEPTAAAIAYGLDIETGIAKNVLIYDLGGGTFDVSILNIHKNVFEVKATTGESHLGGEDFDNRMMETFAEIFKRKHNVDISDNKKALRRLRTKCERAKRTLSAAKQTFVDIDLLADGIDFRECVTRVQFEEMCADLFQLTIKIVKEALKDANMKSADIDTIVLVGGSTRIPKISQLLREVFPDKEICKTIDADEAVAHGAAIQAAIIHGNASREMKNMVLMEVTPLTLGTDIREEEGLVIDPLIKRNTRIPVCKSRSYYTVKNYQTRMSFSVLQGEHRLAKDNFEIGKFTIGGIPAACSGAEKVTATFSIDENGILTVSAVCRSNRKARGEITIKNVCGSLTNAEIDQMIADAEKYRLQDKEAKQYYTARWELEQYCAEIRIKYGLRNSSIREKCDEILAWLNNCSRPRIAQFLQFKNELKSLIQVDKKPKIENGIVVDDADDVEVTLSEDDIIEIDDE